MKKTAVIFLMALLVAAALWVWSKNQNSEFRSQESKVVETPLAVTPVWSKEVRSGDGGWLLKVTGEDVGSGETVCSLTVTEVKTGTFWLVDKLRLSKGETLELPFNAWSPNNKQFFVEQNSLEGKRYLVFKADGTGYKDEEHHVDVVAYWMAKKMGASVGGLEVGKITGWAGTDLLIIKTNRGDGNRGPSFWFVTASRSFLQLRS